MPDRAVDALRIAKGADLLDVQVAWKEIAREWEMLATVADLQHALMEPRDRSRPN